MQIDPNKLQAIVQIIRADWEKDAIFEEKYTKLYAELRELTRCHMQRRRWKRTLQATEVVDQILKRLQGRSNLPKFQTPEDLLNYFQKAVSHTLLEHLRKLNSSRRPPPDRRVDMDVVNFESI